MEDLKCPICGEPTYLVYGKSPRKDRLCKKHGDMVNFKKLALCEKCGEYYETNKEHNCKNENTKDNSLFTELPTEGFEECQCCGKKTTGYAFCRNCFHEHGEEELLNILNKNLCQKAKNDTFSYENVSTTNSNDKSKEEHTTCIICGENSNGKSICKSCYSEVITLQTDLDKNKKPWELKDYYYNLKAFIGRLKDYQEAIQNLYKLYAIAGLLQKIYNDSQLSNVVDNDVQYLLKGIEKIKELKINEKQQQNAKTIIAVADIEKNRASDGHICKSGGEVIIDDILFKGGVCHAYERRVKEIPCDIERSVIADWFVPLSGFDGIYIEYWGMATKDYQDNKNEKLKLYEKYADDVKLIEIEKDDINDRQILEDTIFSKLKKLGWHK